MTDLHGIILAYRPHYELGGLVRHRTADSLPYGGRYRVIDFMLSNMVNSGINDVAVVMHEGYQSLMDHIGSGKAWDISRNRGGIAMIPPNSYAGGHPSERQHGMMGALMGASGYMGRIHQDYVVLAHGDIIANLPLDEVFREHLASGADISTVCLRGSIDPEDQHALTVGSDGFARRADLGESGAFEELGVYIISKRLLIELMSYCGKNHLYTLHGDVILGMRDRIKTHIYLFDGYTRRLNSAASYFSDSMELLDPSVRAELFQADRPILTKGRDDAPTYYAPGSASRCSLVADGCYIEGEAINSILFRGVRIKKGARVENCILMQDTVVGENSSLRCVITDKNVVLSPNALLAGLPKAPVVIPKNEVV